jgi:chlorobactene glucosyltransferase
MIRRAGRYLLRLAARALQDDRGVLVYIAGVCANTAWNLRNTPVLADGSRPERWRPSVAVLVPARNEERGIERCVRSLLAQEWEALRVIVLDDGSTDRTADILARLQQEDGRLTVLRGSPLPDGWLGKPWACAQLAEAAADAELLVFADADTWHAPGMVAAVAAAMERERLDLLSVVPRQELGGAWERWTVPLIPWALMTHLSPAAAQRFGLAFAAGAVGQVLAFRREAYGRLGGHAAVRSAAAEDVAFARLATRAGLRWRVASGREVSACRMYRGRSEALAGLEKNLFPAMGGRTVPYVLAWAWLLRAFTWPALALVIGAAAGRRRAAAAGGAELVLGAATWLAVARKFGLPLRLAAEGPLVAAAGAFAAARSLAAWRGGRAEWKGRRLAG